MKIRKVAQSAGLVASVLNIKTESNKDTYSCNYINNLTGKILWTNAEPDSNFEAQTIDLNTDEYNYFKIFAKLSTINNLVQTQEIIAGYNGRFQYETGGGNERYYRNFTATSNSIIFEDGKIYNTSEAVSNNLIIPMYVIGYKTGLFEEVQ